MAARRRALWGPHAASRTGWNVYREGTWEGGTAIRTEDPVGYWSIVGVELVGGAFLVWYGLHLLPY
jgi:hypothetical protein